jgi:hypothetical protein
MSPWGTGRHLALTARPGAILGRSMSVTSSPSPQPSPRTAQRRRGFRPIWPMGQVRLRRVPPVVTGPQVERKPGEMRGAETSGDATLLRSSDPAGLHRFLASACPAPTGAPQTPRPPGHRRRGVGPGGAVGAMVASIVTAFLTVATGFPDRRPCRAMKSLASLGHDEGLRRPRRSGRTVEHDCLARPDATSRA